MNTKTIRNDGQRSAFTLIELLVVVAIIALLISILLPSLARARELSRRSVCAANLKGMGTGFYTYANENNDIWPIADGATATTEGVSVITYAGNMMGSKRGSNADITAGETFGYPTPGETAISNSRNLWTLIRLQISSPKSFVCPSTDDGPNDEDTPQAYWDFGRGNATSARADATMSATAWKQCSYGYQVPYGLRGRPSSDRDQRMPMAADKGPYSGKLDGGKTDEPNPRDPNLPVDASPEQWKRWNSWNHGGVDQGEGQNVLFAGAHVEWVSKPCIGIGSDNLYTRWSAANADLNGRVRGNAPQSPTATYAPMTDTDSLIYP